LSTPSKRRSSENRAFHHLLSNYAQKDSLLQEMNQAFNTASALATLPEDRTQRMREEHLRSLRADGHTLAYHSKNHEVLSCLTGDTLSDEITIPPAFEGLLTDASCIAIPFGFVGTYDQDVLQVCSEHGYRSIFLNEPRSNVDGVFGRYNLPNSPFRADWLFEISPWKAILSPKHWS
ncbi:MAG: hypothetical protein RLP15_06395, partial [Cryomorphaceae bacterium]